MGYLADIAGAPSIPVLYEDNHLLVVSKPAGLLAQGDATGRPNILDLAKEYIRVRHNKPGKAFIGLVHRLDRPVAGVMVLARTSKAASRLSLQFRGGVPHKLYHAVVHQAPDPPEGKIDSWLAWRHRKCEITGPEDPKAKHAVLEYRLLESSAGLALVEVRLMTGRRHQIRAQLAGLGHAILGDGQYGSPERLKSGAIGLMALSLTFTHPTLKEEMTFSARPDPDWPWPP